MDDGSKKRQNSSCGRTNCNPDSIKKSSSWPLREETREGTEVIMEDGKKSKDTPVYL